MAGFDATWLALREPADRAARDPGLIRQAARDLSRHPAPVVCDLGAGTGSAFRAFDPEFPEGTRWTLVDDNPEVLAEAKRLCGPGVDTRLADLMQEPGPWPDDCTLVTASALFDLAGADWVAAFVAALARDRLPLLTTLTYDGIMECDPVNSGDAAILDGFNRHQRTDKGLGGPALGPAAAAHLAEALAAQGYKVTLGSSPWVLTRDAHPTLISELLTGIAGAAVEIGQVTPVEAQVWLKDRQANLTRLTIGHLDLYATPPS